MPEDYSKYTYTISEGGIKYTITTIGCMSPQALLKSFQSEVDVRAKWWRPKPGDTVLDVGAGFGSYTLPALARGAHVYAYEPGIAECFSLLTQLTINSFTAQCAIIPAVAGDVNGLVESFYDLMCSAITFGGVPSTRYVLPIDDLVHGVGMEHLEWIKIDVEGAEVEVLFGAMKSITAHKPRLLIENHLGYRPGVDEEIRALLLPLGYKEEQMHGVGENDHWSFWTP